MNRSFKILFVLMGICMIYALLNYYPVISATFDDDGYVDGETFTPVNGTCDLKKISLNSSENKNFTAFEDSSGVVRLVDGKGRCVINVLEWDKMSRIRHNAINSSLMDELIKPSHTVDNISIIDAEVNSTRFYGAYAYDENSNIGVYIATPTEKETAEMMRTLEFR